MVTKAVILAGGRGSQLGTSSPPIPKPLLPVNGSTVLDVIIAQLKAHACTDLTLTVGRLAPLIQAVLNRAPRQGVTIRYYVEQEPLGTVGALPELDQLDDTFLMMNGDVLTALDYQDLCDAHFAAGNALTIAAHRRQVRLDYGVLHLEEVGRETQRVSGYEEKPTLGYTVSMGVYVVEPKVIKHIPRGRSFDVPDLVMALTAAGERVGSYEYEGPWFDLSRPDDFVAANERFQELKPLLLSGPDPDPR